MTDEERIAELVDGINDAWFLGGKEYPHIAEGIARHYLNDLISFAQTRPSQCVAIIRYMASHLDGCEFADPGKKADSMDWWKE